MKTWAHRGRAASASGVQPSGWATAADRIHCQDGDLGRIGPRRRRRWRGQGATSTASRQRSARLPAILPRPFVWL